MHNQNQWKVTFSAENKLFSRDAKSEKQELLEMLNQLQQNYNHFKEYLVSNVADIRRSLLTKSPPTVIIDSKSDEKKIEKNVTENTKKIRHIHEEKSIESKPNTTSLPDLTDDDANDSHPNEKAFQAVFKCPDRGAFSGRAKNVKTEMFRPQSAKISSTVKNERHYSEIKSPLAREILKRRHSTCEVPRPDPMPRGVRAMAIKKRRISHMVARSPFATDHDEATDFSKVQVNRETSEDEESTYESSFGTPSLSIGSDSNVSVKWPHLPSKNISEIAKMMLERCKAIDTEPINPKSGLDEEVLISSDTNLI